MTTDPTTEAGRRWLDQLARDVRSECLWVVDATRKHHHDPESLRCRRGGVVWCAPCLRQQNAPTTRKQRDHD